MRRLIGLMTTVAAGVVACALPQVSSRAGEKAAATVTARDLMLAYKADKKAADAKYNGKVIEVKGVVKLVSVGSRPSITLEGGTEFRNGMRCAFGAEYQKALTAMRRAKTVDRGVTVTIKGTCNGISSVTRSIQMDNCVLVDPPLTK